MDLRKTWRVSLIKKLLFKLKKVPNSLYSVGSLMGLAAINYAIIHDPLVFLFVLVLFVHELGHYITAKKNKVKAKLPVFIPLPFVGIGITKINKTTADIEMKIAASGPLYSTIFLSALAILNIFKKFISMNVILIMAVSELTFNYIGSDGARYRKAKRELTPCI